MTRVDWLIGTAALLVMIGAGLAFDRSGVGLPGGAGGFGVVAAAVVAATIVVSRRLRRIR